MKLSNSQLIKLKSGIKNGTEVTLSLPSNVGGNSNDVTNFPHKSSLTITKVSMIHKAFVNGSSANRKLSKFELSKMDELEFLSGLLAIFDKMMGSAMKFGLKVPGIVCKIKQVRAFQKFF